MLPRRAAAQAGSSYRVYMRQDPQVQRLHEASGPLNGRRLLSGWIRTPGGPNDYFFLGDSRAHSCDSRTWGTVPRKKLIGPVLFTYWPPTRLSLREIAARRVLAVDLIT